MTAAGRELFNTFWHGADLSPWHWACLGSFIRRGHRVRLFSYRPLALPPGVEPADASTIIPEGELFAFQDSFSAFSNVFRYQLLLQEGGWWIDTDVYCLIETVPACRYAWARESAEFINGAILKFPAGDPVLARLLAAAGDSSSPRFTLMVEIDPLTAPSSIQFDLQPKDVGSLQSAAAQVGQQFIATAAIYGVNHFADQSTLRYALVWQTQPALVANALSVAGRKYCSLVTSTTDNVDPLIEKFGSGFARPDLAVVATGTPKYGQRYGLIFCDDMMPELKLLHDLDESTLLTEIQSRFNATVPQWPIRISATEMGGKSLFSVLFVAYGHVDPLPRTLTVKEVVAGYVKIDGIDFGEDAGIDPGTKPGTKPPPGGLDPNADPAPVAGGLLGNTPPLLHKFSGMSALLIQRMREYSIRVGQIAVAKNGRLVYAAAITWAEDGYPIAEITTRMRVGSISKVVTAVATMRIVERNELPDDLETPLDVALNASPEDLRFNTHTVDHALAHLAFKADSAIGPLVDLKDSVLPWMIANGVGDTIADITDLAYTNFLLGTPYTPGDSQDPDLLVTNSLFQQSAGPALDGTKNIAYSGVGFYLLGRLPDLREKTPYIGFVRLQVFERMGMSPTVAFNRVAPTIWRAANAPGDASECRYHAKAPSLGHNYATGVTGSQAPIQYEGMNAPLGLANGALSMPAIDVARLFSNLGTKSYGLFEKTSTLGVFRSIVAVNRCRGTAVSLDSNMNTVYSHNGGISGGGGLGFWRDDDLAVAILVNCDIPKGMGAVPISFGNEGQLICSIADSIDSWPSQNLFPEFP